MSDAAHTQAAVQLAARYDRDVLCEEFITGQELTCPVIGSGADARALPIVRIEAPEGAYDYQNKYFTDVVRYHCPSGLPPAQEQSIQVWCPECLVFIRAHAFFALLWHEFMNVGCLNIC